MSDNSINVNSFFAGIGGFDLGFERQGFTNSFICENNDFCNEVLAITGPTFRSLVTLTSFLPTVFRMLLFGVAGFLVRTFLLPEDPCQDWGLRAVALDCSIALQS